LRNDSFEFLDTPCRGIDVRRSESSADKLLAAKNVERQIAVVSIVSVKESALLVAVKWIIGRIKVQKDALWRFRESLQENVHEKPLDGIFVDHDFLVATLSVGVGRCEIQTI
jgi:hypothetical protein